MKPKIAIVSLYDEKNNLIKIKQTYINAIIDLGGIPYIIPYTNDNEVLKEFLKDMDGYLFTGGEDINPLMYGEEIQSYCGFISNIRDNHEALIYNIIKDMDKPILGICRGAQFLNVMYGGTLYQDINNQVNSKVNHNMDKPYTNSAHKVYLEKGSYIQRIIKEDYIEVNSIHHQAVKDIGVGLTVNGVSKDGIIEAFQDKNKKYLVGVQWHPEYLYNTSKASRIIFENFINSSKPN